MTQQRDNEIIYRFEKSEKTATTTAPATAAAVAAARATAAAVVAVSMSFVTNFMSFLSSGGSH